VYRSRTRRIETLGGGSSARPVKVEIQSRRAEGSSMTRQGGDRQPRSNQHHRQSGQRHALPCPILKSEVRAMPGAWTREADPLYRRSFPDFAVRVSSPDSEARGPSGTFGLPVPLTGTELQLKFNRLRERLDGLQRLSDPERLIWADPRPSGRRTIHVPIPPNVPPIVPE